MKKHARHCSVCGSRYHDARKHHRRNPSRKAPPSHDLFGERSHKLDMFGGKTYQAVPKAKKSAAERKREAKKNAGQGAFDFGLTRSLFG